MAGARYRPNPKFINRNGYSFSFRAVLEPGGLSFMPTQTIVVTTEVIDALGGKATKRVIISAVSK